MIELLSNGFDTRPVVDRKRDILFPCFIEMEVDERESDENVSLSSVVTSCGLVFFIPSSFIIATLVYLLIISTNEFYLVLLRRAFLIVFYWSLPLSLYLFLSLLLGKEKEGGGAHALWKLHKICMNKLCCHSNWPQHFNKHCTHKYHIKARI